MSNSEEERTVIVPVDGLGSIKQVRIPVVADPNVKFAVEFTPEREPLQATDNPDGTLDYSWDLWPTPNDVREYGELIAAPVPDELVVFVGRVIINSALLERRVKDFVQRLSNQNGSPLEWGALSKFGKIVTRLQEEASLIRKQAPTAAKLLHDASEKTRKLHRSRGNLAHGDISIVAYDGEIQLVAIGRHEEQRFTVGSLRDLALQMCKVSCELEVALDPEDQNVQRPSREKRFLRDFQANNPPIHPKLSKPPRPPRSSKRKRQI